MFGGLPVKGYAVYYRDQNGRADIVTRENRPEDGEMESEYGAVTDIQIFPIVDLTDVLIEMVSETDDTVRDDPEQNYPGEDDPGTDDLFPDNPDRIDLGSTDPESASSSTDPTQPAETSRPAED